MALKKMLIFLLITSLLFNFSLTTFAHTATIENAGSNDYKSVRLPRQLLNNANKDLSDVRIKDQDGNQVPYFIRELDTESVSATKEYSFYLADSFTKDDQQIFDFHLDSYADGDIQATGITVNPDPLAQFVKDITVSGSYDGLNWEYVTSDNIYVVDSHSDCDISFLDIEKYTYYRLSLSGSSEPIDLYDILVSCNISTTKNNYFLENFKPEYDVTPGENNTTQIAIKGVKNLEIDEIIIDSSDMFMRDVLSPNHGTTEIYNLNFKERSYSNNSVPMYGYSSNDNGLTFIINNNDNAPININSITVSYYAPELTFKGATNSNYTIEFSGDNSAIKPVYDISSYKSQVLQEAINPLKTGNITLETAPQVEKPKDYSLLLNIVVVVAAIILAIIIILNLGKGKNNKEPTL